jgi:hypothetical protein
MERIFFAEEKLIFCALKGSKITHINPLHQLIHPGELMLSPSANLFVTIPEPWYILIICCRAKTIQTR